MSATTKELVARTGRVQSWIDDPTSRLPVSCTVFVVEDSMEGANGIEASWRFVSHALRFEQELQFIYQSSDPKEVKMAKVLQLLDLYHSHRSTQP